MKQWAKLVCILVLTVCNAAFAVRVKSLYQAELPVVSQSESDRSAAIKEGFKTVLVKLSGDPDIENKKIIKANIKKAEYFVQEYSYLGGNPLDISQYNIRINYNQPDISRLFKRAGIPMWGEIRPLILVWLAVKKADQAEIIGTDSGNRLIEVMHAEGKKFGLPIIFPMMDMTDIERIATSNGMDFSLSTLQEAGKRYSPDALLIGFVETQNAEYISHWRLVLPGREWQWDNVASSTDDIVKKIINDVIQKLAKQYATN